MTNSLSDRHKLLITTRPNTYEDLKSILCKSKLSMTSLTLGLFQDHNVMEMIQSLIIDDENKEAFKALYNSLGDVAKRLLRNPLNLNLYIKLWIQDPELEINTFTTKKLFLNTICNNLTLLKERLYLSTSLSKEDLEGYVDDWFYGSLCKQSFLMLTDCCGRNRYTEFLEILKKDARKCELKPSTCLSTFLVKEKENEGEIRYEFHHLTQQFVLASLFLKRFKDYDGERLINEMKKVESKLSEISDILTFYVEMFNEDGSMNSDIEEVFSPIQLIITLPDFKYRKQDLLFSTSVAVNFNSKYMEKVSQVFKDIPCLKIVEFYDFSCTVFIKFLEFVQPQKIIFFHCVFFQFGEGFQSIIDFLIKFKIEIKLESYLDRKENVRSTFGKDLNVTALRANRRSYLKKITGKRLSRDLEEFSCFCKSLWLPENQTFEQLEIWLEFDPYCEFADCNVYDIVSLPKKIVEITILGLSRGFYIELEKYEALLEFLTKINEDTTLKFKALHLPYVGIIETDQQYPTDLDALLTKDKRLLEIAHSVSDDSFYQYEKFWVDLFNDVNLNLTEFIGTMDSLDLLSNHNANLKTVSLRINSEDVFFRMLTFLCNSKKSLSEVNLHFFYLNQWKRKCILDKIRALGNDFTIPKELVQHTSIAIDIDTDEENFKDYFAFLKHVKGDETLKFKALDNIKYEFTLEQRKMLLDQITSELNVVTNTNCWKQLGMYYPLL